MRAAAVPALVLDPFAGTGTTLAVAKELGRHGVGIDLKREYLDMAAERIAAVQPPLPTVTLPVPPAAECAAQLPLIGDA